MQTHPCPKCGRTLQQAGEATLYLDGKAKAFPVFQCDDCTMPLDFGAGPKIEGAYTFALDEEGHPFDPGSSH